jgi:hypothetical protein
MPIPTALDHRLAEVDDLAASILITLRTMRYSPIEPDQLRLRLQEFTDVVIDIANGIIANAERR